ncbi:UDP-glucose 4-epimerase [Bacteroidia bacterium]|nr:UDP-glucose 4-epimerase [Bacteroidia bacterium]GHU94798.1 UDP-glucose 4-epimerase [Bacteroidia bacterium]
MKKILVTGGTGYIGSHTVVEAQQAGYEVVIVDNLCNSQVGVIERIQQITGIRPAFEQVDCTDMAAMEEVFKKHPQIGAVIHFAAFKAVGESVQKPLQYYHNNLRSLWVLLTLLPKYEVGNLVFSSSCTVYGQPDHLPVTEQTPRKPAESPYGNTKQICEDIITDAVRAGIPVQGILLRYFNPIGSHPSAKIGELPIGTPQNLVPFVTQTAAGIRPQLRIFGNDYNTPDGSCIRDYINVVDLAKAHIVAVDRMLKKQCKKPVEVFNLGTGKGVSVLEIVRTFERATGVKLPYEIVERRAGDIEQIWADTTFANTELGWQAHETLEDTLSSAWKWQQTLQ